MQKLARKVIDGTTGGGQVLRNAFAYSALTGREIEVVNIRGARNPPGLKAQHLEGVQLCGRVAAATLQGDAKGSVRVAFKPSGRLAGGLLQSDAKTAGSVTLLVQTALPLLLFAPNSTGDRNVFEVKGGTDVGMSPPLDFFTHVFLPMAAKFGVKAEVSAVTRGVFPKGGGKLRLEVERRTAPLTPITLESIGSPVSATAHCFVAPAGARSERDLAELRQLAEKQLAQMFPSDSVSKRVVGQAAAAANHGAALVFVVETDAGCTVAGSALKDPKGDDTYAKMARSASTMLARQLAAAAPVDEHLQDQLLILAVLAEGVSKYATGPITEHTQEAIKVAHELTDAKIEVTKLSENTNLITCTGIGYMPPS